ncbi:uncharacterized protein LOC121387812 isoform X1 [Gigantopelta aegis]|uniref:uncharacterized protein LOC121387812 isoform X1 n=1 Tax=Gigantopelta aegis TaxID=1735272 RepID=UPI001B88755A|nr:uncharacterized protein LOC121387812 isoform X1 [Gigantopelta aegis]XP_041374959.1 uncharacterized protein LOC121387812 isoform X1 [Gigantopelta aegis]
MKTLPYKVETSEDGGKSTVHFPGISYLSSGPSGLLTPWAILQCIEGGQIVGLTNTVLRRSNMFTIIMSQTFDFNWENIAYAKRDMTFPYTITLDIVGIGRTSLQWKQTMVNSMDGSCLATGLVHMVLMDSASRRPREIPLEFKKKYCRFVKQSPFAVINIPEIPAVCVSLPVTVPYSDIGPNSHFNQACFFKHAFNCVRKANQIRPFYRFGKDIGERAMKKNFVLFKGESFEGDQLVFSCWQDRNQPQHIHTVITNNDRVLAYIKMTLDILEESKL